MEGSVYLKARQEWDERYADLVLGKRNWSQALGRCGFAYELMLGRKRAAWLPADSLGPSSA